MTAQFRKIHRGVLARMLALEAEVIQAVGRWLDKVSADVLIPARQRSSRVALLASIQSIIPELIDIVGAGLERQREETWDATVDALVAALTPEQATSLAKQRLPEEAVRMPAGVFQESEDWMSALVAGDVLTRDDAGDALRELVFKPMSKRQATRILKKSIWGDTLTWDQRIKGIGRHANFKQIARQLSDGIAAGDDVAGLAKRLRPLQNGVRYRAQRIARTESGRVAEMARQETYKDMTADIPTKQVLAVIDSHTRQEHLERHGTLYTLDARTDTYFSDQGEPEPVVPDAPNCRCYSVPVFFFEQPTDVGREQQREMTKRDSRKARQPIKRRRAAARVFPADRSKAKMPALSSPEQQALDYYASLSAEEREATLPKLVTRRAPPKTEGELIFNRQFKGLTKKLPKRATKGFRGTSVPDNSRLLQVGSDVSLAKKGNSFSSYTTDLDKAAQHARQAKKIGEKLVVVEYDGTFVDPGNFLPSKNKGDVWLLRRDNKALYVQSVRVEQDGITRIVLSNQKPIGIPVQVGSPIAKPIRLAKTPVLTKKIVKPRVARGKLVPRRAANTIDTSNVTGSTRRATDETLATIDSIHTVPEGMETIPLRETGDISVNGAFAQLKRKGTRSKFDAEMIEISKAGKHQSFTFAHEFGHYLDSSIIGGDGIFASETLKKAPVAYKRVMKTLEGSGPVKRLRQMLTGTDATGRVLSQQAFGGTSNANTLNYLLSPTEQFARAYSQWIVERGSNKTLKKELKSVLKRSADAISKWETQWSAAEFEPIAEAFDALFSDLGLLK